MRLFAEKKLTLTSESDISFAGKKRITLIGGGSYLKLEAGKVEYGTTATYMRKVKRTMAAASNAQPLGTVSLPPPVSILTFPCEANFVTSTEDDTFEKSTSGTNEQAASEPPVPNRSFLHDRAPSTGRAFSQNYQIERGDLIYGLREYRGKYINEIYPGFSLNDRKIPPMVIDVYNNSVIYSVSTNNDMNEISKLITKKPEKLIRKLIVPGGLEDKVKAYRDGDNYLWREYFDVGEENPKFNIQAVYKEVADNYGKDEYHAICNDFNGVAPKLLWKRGSKLGIEMTARNATHHLHFVLDGLSLPEIVNKTLPHGASVTASELRYAYRNRNRLRGKLHFYQEGREVTAPWESSPVLWSEYTPSSMPAPPGDNARISNSASTHKRKSFRHTLSGWFRR